MRNSSALATLALLVAGGAAAFGKTSTTPVLGAPTPGHHAQRGLGEVRPRQVHLDGSRSNLVKKITWKTWGGSRAVGHGLAEYLPPGNPSSQGPYEKATIVAYHLGRCHGRRAYLRVIWYFPQHGGRFTTSLGMSFGGGSGPTCRPSA